MPGALVAYFIGAEIVSMVENSGLVAKAVLVILLVFSLFSWAVIFAKWAHFHRASFQSQRFLRAFRRTQKLSDLAALGDQFRPSPLVEVFDSGYQALREQLRSTGAVGNPGEGRLTRPAALERSLQIAAAEQMARMESTLSWLATTGAVTPFIGLFGTVWGIMDAFHGLGTAGAASLRAVAPGISEALITTAAGLFTAVPAVIAYNSFVHTLRRFGGSMDNFALEFLNLAERDYT